ncbi:hypothetical protein BCL74_0887 [Oceanibaculum indicum]|uniref:Uncharacterized protein n=1 Tax=Oceanibaculum indicum TaxID=526216 RepID=A0A420WQ01_9PROT|nr:hypothetical protein BCL74_0887 [Oceanibaculum indicum]
MEGLSIGDVVGGVQVAVLLGIFYRLGAVRGEIEGVKHRVQKLEGVMS